MKKVLMILLSLLLSGGAFADQVSNENACDQYHIGNSGKALCYGVSHFDYLTPNRIKTCFDTFKKEDLYKRCIDEAATSDITIKHIKACRSSNSTSVSAKNCLFAAANSRNLTAEDIIFCGESTNWPNAYAACLKREAGDL